MADEPKVESYFDVMGKVVVISADVEQIGEGDEALDRLCEKLNAAGASLVIVKAEGVTLEALSRQHVPAGLLKVSDPDPQVEVEGRIHAARVLEGLWTPKCYLEPGWKAPIVLTDGEDAHPEMVTCQRCLRLMEQERG